MLDQEEFPYTYRVVSEILESNGSSSMATVCGGSLALMVWSPKRLLRDCNGINWKMKIWYSSDILGTEDHIGDMDFKVAGSEKGITIQMVKNDGLPINIMKEALEQARLGRIHIIIMKNKMKTPNKELSSTPKIISSSLPQTE